MTLTGYLQYGRIGARELLAYRGNYLWNLGGLAMQVVLLALVWRAVYKGRSEIEGVDLPTMLAYVTLVNAQLWLLINASRNPLADRVRDGRIALDLCRPVSVFGQVVAGQVGRAVAILPFAAAVVPIGVLVGGLRAPASPLAGVAYAVSFALAFGVAALIGATIAMVAFWTLEVTGIQFINRYVSQFFSGGLVPLWLMPDWLRVTAEVLPFQAIAYTPVSVYLGRIAGAEVLPALAVQALWLAAAYLLGRLVWRRALHKVVIQGG